MANLPCREERQDERTRVFIWEGVTDRDQCAPVDLGSRPASAIFILGGDPGSAAFRLEGSDEGKHWTQVRAPDGWPISLAGGIEIEVDCGDLYPFMRPKRSGASPGMSANVRLVVTE